MANPFNTFRKRQTLVLAVLGVICMLVFVFGEPLQQLLSNRGQMDDPVVVQTKYGSLRRSDLQSMMRRRTQVRQFVESIMYRAKFEKDMEVKEKEALAEQVSNVVKIDFPPESEEEAVRTFILDGLGSSPAFQLQVDDAAVNDFIKRKSEDKLSTFQVREILVRDMRVSEPKFYDDMRTELRALQTRQILLRGLVNMTPAQRWDCFQRLRTMAKVELLPIPVAAMINSVPVPETEQLKQLYEKYKFKVDLPDVADIGFKQPPMAEIEYLMADMESFMSASVTNEDVVAHYKEFKDSKYRDILSDEEFNRPLPEDDAGPAKGSAFPHSAPSPLPEPPAATTPPEASSLVAPANAEQLAVLARDALENTDLLVNADGCQEPKTEPAPQTETPAEAEEAPTYAPESAPEHVPGFTATPRMPNLAIRSTWSLPSSDSYIPKAKALTPILHRQIFEELGIPKATVKMQNALEQIRNRMLKASVETRRQEALRQLDPASAKTSGPVKMEFDLKAEIKNQLGPLADQYPNMLTYHKTPLLKAFDLSKIKGLGESVVQTDPGAPAIPFVYRLFEDLQIHEPEISGEERAGSRLLWDHFLFWKTQEVERKVPSWTSARDEVKNAYLMGEARKKLRELCDRWSHEATTKGYTSLKEAWDSSTGAKELRIAMGGGIAEAKDAAASSSDLTPFQVHELPPFTWLVPPEQLGSFRFDQITQLPGIPMGGHTFMRGIFSLDEGQFGVTMNDSQQILYLVHVQGMLRPSYAEFMSGSQFITLFVAQIDQQETVMDLMEFLNEDSDVTWLVEPADPRVR